MQSSSKDIVENYQEEFVNIPNFPKYLISTKTKLVYRNVGDHYTLMVGQRNEKNGFRGIYLIKNEMGIYKLSVSMIDEFIKEGTPELYNITKVTHRIVRQKQKKKYLKRRK